MVHLLGDNEGNIANGVDCFRPTICWALKRASTERVTAFLSGETRRGDNVTITADSRLCTEIVNIFRNTSNLKGKCGAVVVMNYKTGEVLALVSLPVYDPQNITDQVRNSSQPSLLEPRSAGHAASRLHVQDHHRGGGAGKPARCGNARIHLHGRYAGDGPCGA